MRDFFLAASHVRKVGNGFCFTIILRWRADE